MLALYFFLRSCFMTLTHREGAASLSAPPQTEGRPEGNRNAISQHKRGRRVRYRARERPAGQKNRKTPGDDVAIGGEHAPSSAAQGQSVDPPKHSGCKSCMQHAERPQTTSDRAHEFHIAGAHSTADIKPNQ